MGRPREKYWYALKVYRGKMDQTLKFFREHRCELFSPAIIPSLLFVKCQGSLLENSRKDHWDKYMFYKDAKREHPGPIPDHEFEAFRLATSDPTIQAEYLGEDTQKYMSGDKVRVIDGPYKGYEGFIHRIKHDRKLVVCIQGVAVVAFSDVRMEFVEKL